MKVKVVGTSQVVHDGKVYTEGDVFDAPAGDVEQWVSRGYVEKVESKSAEKAAVKDKAASEPPEHKAEAPRSARRRSESDKDDDSK